MSPQNVMVGYDASVKIVDFGIAKAASWADTTRAGVLKGKFGYMSPEQARGEKLDSRTDIFALGIILFETLTQRRLFTSDDDLRTIKMVKECNIPRPSKYNPSPTSQLDRIVLKALDKNKADRYQNAQELYEDLTVYMNQKYPKFVSTELSKFLRELFKDDIEEQKKKREKQAAEAPAIMGSPNNKPKPSAAKLSAAPGLDDKDKTDAGDDNEENPTLTVQCECPRCRSSNTCPASDLDLPDVADKKENIAPPQAIRELKTEVASQLNANLANSESEEVSLTSGGISAEINGLKPGMQKAMRAPSPMSLKTNTAVTEQQIGFGAGSFPKSAHTQNYTKLGEKNPKNYLRLGLTAAVAGIASYYLMQNPDLLKTALNRSIPLQWLRV